MLTALRAKNKLGCTNGSLKRSTAKEDEDFSECHAWDMTNSMMCSWLLNVIDPKIKMTLVYFDAAKSMWEDLRK